MGEYVQFQGNSVKLGTCEDLMYVRRIEVEHLALRASKLEGSLTPDEYLKAKHRWFYRFPWPHEDGRELSDAFNCSPENGIKGTAIYMMDGIKITAPHDTYSVSVSVLGHGSYNVNVQVPCPHLLRETKAANGGSKAFACSRIPDVTPLLPYRERILANGKLYTVFECGWCRCTFSIGAEELDKLAIPEALEGRIKARML